MKLSLWPQQNQRGSTLLMVMVLSACTLLVLASILDWTTTNTTLTGRNNEYFRTVAVAEAATEKVIASICSDYQSSGDSVVQANVGSYRQLVPTTQEDPVFGNYRITDAQGNAGRSYVQYLGPSAFRLLTAQYRGLYGYSSIFRVISNARDTTSRYNITGAVWQDVEVATIPLFQFAIFYNLDLEIEPGAVMTVTGPTHGNKNLYFSPGAALTFQGDVTGAGSLINTRMPIDPRGGAGGGTVTFQGEHDSGVSTLNLPIGTNNTSAAVHQVVEQPPVGELVTSALGSQRIYNKADVIVTVSDPASGITPVVSVTSGIVNNKATILNAATAGAGFRWLNVLPTLFNKRENKTVREVEIDVQNLVAWNSSTNNTLPVRAVTGGTKDVTVIYVDDKRAMGVSEETGVVVRRGQVLPPYGLTIVTPEPIYVVGDYNVPDAAKGTHDTSGTKPAALIGDSITVLSAAWNALDLSYGTRDWPLRVALPTTVNAAFLGGIVETTASAYSGGVENFPRFLEDWSGRTFTYNGSMVVMYPSQYSLGMWPGTGNPPGVYNPPNRNWAFDTNFRDPAKLPPGTPAVRVLVRGAYAMIKPNTTTITDADALDPTAPLP